MPRLIAAGLVTIACSAPPTPGVEYPNELAWEVHAAASRWRVATGLRLHGVTVRELADQDGCDAEHNRLGYYQPSTRAVVVCGRARTPQPDTFSVRDRVAWTVLHEFGHALGADHHRARGVLRVSIDGASACLTPADVDAVCSWAPCLWEAPECVLY